MRAVALGARLVRSRRPSVVLALGGYASLGPSIGAVLNRSPIVVAEQNARAGAANRVVARFARACAVPFDETDLPHAVVTGNPVRAEILSQRRLPERTAARRIEARHDLDMPIDRAVVVVFAGSLGSRRINEAVVGLVERWAGRSDVHVHHVVGRRDLDELDQPSIGPDGIGYERVGYEDRMDRVLAAADLAVCRAGGTTVAELAVIGVPAVLVPLPIATRDHQTLNAGPLARAGAAVVVSDSECDTDRLEAEIGALLGDRALLARMAEAAYGIARPDAAEAVADLLERFAR